MAQNRRPDRYISAQPIPGERLPSDWQQMAPRRAALAEASYRHRLENAWRGDGQALNIIQQASLANNDAMPDQLARQARLTSPLSWNELLGDK